MTILALPKDLTRLRGHEFHNVGNEHTTHAFRFFSRKNISIRVEDFQISKISKMLTMWPQSLTERP